MVRKDLKMWIAAMILGGAVVIGFPSCDDPEVMNSLKELQEKDSISSANLEKLKTLLEKAEKKVAETEQELQKIKENKGGGSSDFSEIEESIKGLNSQISSWKKNIEEKIDSLPTAQEIEEIKSKLNGILYAANANGHEFVDLGLSVLWATCNVGAENPEDVGDYFAWGEVEPKKTYVENNYTAGDWKQDLDAAHDAATYNWGGKWRMPSKEELEELKDTANCVWTRNDEKKGFDVKSKKNGNSIYLPAAGVHKNGALASKDVYGGYLSYSFEESKGKHYLYFNQYNYIGMGFSNNPTGQSVRPVLDKE